MKKSVTWTYSNKNYLKNEQSISELMKYHHKVSIIYEIRVPETKKMSGEEEVPAYQLIIKLLKASNKENLKRNQRNKSK